MVFGFPLGWVCRTFAYPTTFEAALTAGELEERFDQALQVLLAGVTTAGLPFG
jgi:hypothetical protein